MELRIKHFSDSLESLKYLLDVDISSLQEVLDARLLDALENGKAQKFEIVPATSKGVAWPVSSYKLVTKNKSKKIYSPPRHEEHQENIK